MNSHHILRPAYAIKCHPQLELSDSCGLSIIVIVSNNHDYDSIVSYYCDKLCISVLSQKRSKHDIVKVKVHICESPIEHTTKITTVIHNSFYQWSVRKADTLYLVCNWIIFVLYM